MVKPLSGCHPQTCFGDVLIQGLSSHPQTSLGVPPGSTGVRVKRFWLMIVAFQLGNSITYLEPDLHNKLIGWSPCGSDFLISQTRRSEPLRFRLFYFSEKRLLVAIRRSEDTFLDLGDKMVRLTGRLRNAITVHAFHDYLNR